MSKRTFYRYQSQARIVFNLHDPDRNISGEMAMLWEELDGELVPQLQVWDDGWAALAAMPDLLQKLGEYDDKNITPDQFAELLQACGFVEEGV